MPTKARPPVTKNVTALVARTQFGQIMDRARNKRERFVVSKNGDPKVVVMSVEDYLENVLKTPDSLAALQADARRRGLDHLSAASINTVIRRTRDEKGRTPRR